MQVGWEGMFMGQSGQPLPPVGLSSFHLQTRPVPPSTLSRARVPSQGTPPAGLPCSFSTLVLFPESS